MSETQKAVLSNRIYFKPRDNDELKRIINTLTYKIEKKHATGAKNKFVPIEIIKNYKMLPQGIISIPQGRLDLVPEGLELLDKRVFHEVPFPLPKHELREGQQAVYDEIEDTCLVNALVGWGKTFTALHLARKLGQKTLVITHTTMLRDQWLDEIKELFGIEAGIIGSGKFDIEDHCIVVGNVQTVTKLMPQLAKEFGTLILDECHHCPATTFATIVDASYARYRIGLSGTLVRTDGKHVVLKDYFGPHVITPPQSHTMNPSVRIVPTGIQLPAGKTYVEKINILLYDEDYQEFVAALAKVQIAKGHSVLIVANRVEFLTKVREFIGDDAVCITGETDYEERKRLLIQVENREKKCVVGSTQIFSEGISCNALSCVILAVPTANPIQLEQIIGRIMRLGEDKLEPLVLDLNFSSWAEKRQNAARLAFYLSKGWKIQAV